MPIDEPSESKERVVSPVEAAEAILLSSPYQPIRQLKCLFRDGELTIAGSVPTFYLKQIAQMTLQQLDGVQRISNIVEVSGNLL
ncbi:MAG TPA: BON domain-containing protein [Pirellulales bacterium]